MEKKIDYITIKTLKDGQLEITSGFHTHYKKEKSGSYSFHIPAFDIYFGAATLEEGANRRSIMIDSYLHFWVEQQGLNRFALELHNRGFRAPSHSVVMGKMIEKRGAKIINAKFKINPVEPTGDFAGAESIHQDIKIAV